MKIAFSISAILFSFIGSYLCIFGEEEIAGLLWLCMAGIASINAKLH